jgi:hypothetical protein
MSDQQNSNGRGKLPQSTSPFNPNEHLIQFKSRNGMADYLPVQWRLVWFREMCPQGTIDTEELEVDLDREMEEEVDVWNEETRRNEKVVKRAKGYARYKAVVTDGKGGRATGTKTEKAVSFPDFVEKAETGAIGRALAALGYGTQFTGDEFDERHRIVDAPVNRAPSVPTTESRSNGQRPILSTTPKVAEKKASYNASNPDEANQPVTEAQLASIRRLYERLGKEEPESTRAMNYVGAKELIVQLSQEYKQSRSSRAS